MKSGNGGTAVMDAPAPVREAEHEAAQQIQGAQGAAQEQLALAKPYPAGRAMQVGGMIPHNLDEAARFAQLVHKSTFIPQAFRDKPGDVLAAVVYGADLGLPPMQALQVIAVINGKPSVYGDGLLAVVYSGPNFQDHDEYYDVNGQRKEYLAPADLSNDATMAVCTFKRKGRSKAVTRTFSIAQAKKANLWGKAGPWQQYPDRMLLFRARGFAARDAFPDQLRGVISAEEAMDIPGTVIESSVIPMPQRTSGESSAATPEPSGSTQSAAAPAATATTDAPSVTQATANHSDPPPTTELPDGADRIIDLAALRSTERKDGNGTVTHPSKPYWKFATKRGVVGFTWSETFGAQLQSAKDAGALVVLTTKPDAQKNLHIATFEPFKG